MAPQLQSICSSIFCHAIHLLRDRPAARPQLGYEMQAPLQCIISATIGLLSHDMSAWLQSVSSAATQQVSCDVSAQLSSAQLLSEGSVATRQLSCQISCNLSAQLHPVSSDELAISAATCWLSCILCPRL